ncbi:hypothetical protein LXA43DRAFT_682179 [Ganoderma leucocontextum]|nr:hypothetical protein LXA43DRAFT_682179 [Ganoderma leucocontextum]
MQSRLFARPDIAEKLIPNFPVCGKRLGPGPGYLEALCKDNVDFLSSPIKWFTESGIETEDGARQDLDIVFCATGYDMSWQLPFSIIGRDGLTLNEKWKDYPVSYLSFAVHGWLPEHVHGDGPELGHRRGAVHPGHRGRRRVRGAGGREDAARAAEA